MAMTYKIMVKKADRENYDSLYKFLTTTVDGVVKPVEFATREEMDVKVEKMLNDEGYSKADFIIVNVVDYTIDAKDYKVP